MSSGQTLALCNRLDFSLPWEEPPVVSGQNSEVKRVPPATQLDHSGPPGDNKPEIMGIVLGRMDLAPLASETWSLLTRRCGLDQSDKIANIGVKRLSHVAALFLQNSLNFLLFFVRGVQRRDS